MLKKRAILLNYIGDISEFYSVIDCRMHSFPCGEFSFSISEDIANDDVTIFQSFSSGQFCHDLFSLLLVCNTIRRSRVGKITLFAPFLPYMRHDRICDTTTSFGSGVVADMINTYKLDGVITYDLHSLENQYLFGTTIKNLSMIPVFISEIKLNHNNLDVVIVYPDIGFVLRSKRFCIDEHFDIAIINKQRCKSGIKMSLLGNVKDKLAIIIDDMIDSGNTIIKAANLLIQSGAVAVKCYATHGIFSGNSIVDIDQSCVSEVFVSNSLMQNVVSDKIKIIKLE